MPEMASQMVPAIVTHRTTALNSAWRMSLLLIVKFQRERTVSGGDVNRSRAID
jgi:hypothetical protein